MRAILDAALAYQAQGKVIVPTCWEDPCQIPAHNKDGPCHGKRSLVLWQDRDTITPEEIRRWWTRWPDADVAILTGARSNLVVIDLDGPEGEAALARLEASHGPLPPTLEVKTKHGRHLYFLHPGPGIKILTRRGDLFYLWGRDQDPATGLDVRGDGGLVVAPPSRDRVYANGLDPSPLPDKLIGPFSTGTTKDHLPPEEMGQALALIKTPGEPCQHVAQALEKYDGHHPGMLKAQLRIVHLGTEGHPGVGKALDMLQDAHQGTDRDWTRGLDGAVADAMEQQPGEGCSDAKVKGLDELAAEMGKEMPTSKEDQDDDKVISGLRFLDLAETDQQPAWGDTEVCLWMPGESLMLVGPPGVGKTTLAHLIFWARLGLLDTVLGWPVQADGRVLYLAMDRPKQIARAMRRLLLPEHREIVDARLVVRPGPLPVDLAEKPKWTTELAEKHGAGTIIVDSLKDVLPDPSDEKRAGQYNLARQHALAAGIEWIELHHNRKAGAGNKEPNTLEDVYGSRWLTAGAGSVLSLYGDAGDTVVSLKQLKSPAGELFPRRVILDKHTGTMELYEDVDAVMLLTRAGRGGYTVRGLAMALHHGTSPSTSQVEAVRLKLKRMAKAGEVEEFAHPVDGTQAFRTTNTTNTPPTPTSTPEPTPPTRRTKARVKGSNTSANATNAKPTHRGGLIDPDVGREDQETATPADPYAKARKRFGGKKRAGS